MAGDISRNSFNPQKHYSGVLMQQGRVQLDADWNEQLAIQSYRTGTETKDVIGSCGVPKKGDSFKIAAAADSADLNIAPGHVYAGGLLCELEATTTAATYLHQPYYPNPDKTYFEIPPASPPNSPVSSPPAPREAKIKDGAYIVYIDAWQREINYLDDPLIHEVVLGEADTATRLQNVWQVKLLRVENAAPTCNTDFEEWKKLTAPPTGKLNVRIEEAEDTKNPCELPPKSGYRRLENQLYRVEVQRGGNRATTTFKWSRDNASVETAIIEKVENNILTVADVGKDEVLGFAGGQWVEIVDEESTLKSSPQQLVQIISVEPSRREITVSTSSIPNKNNGKLKLRRWDQSVNTAGPNGLPATNGWVDIEDGIQVMFSDDTYRAGDYWLIPARTATGEVEWPPYEIPNSFPVAQLPLGIKHYYCRLALLQVQAGKITVHDCRPLFPSLTEICAEDVCYNNSNCKGLTATTVQQALDELCRERDAACTVLALPGPGWEKVFDQIGQGRDAQICFQVGDYPLDRPVNISGKGHLKLTGCGAGTRILSLKSESALQFSACKTVIVRDVYAETGVAGSGKDSPLKNLNGTLTFKDCTSVEVSGTTLKCGSGIVRAANCISVNNQANTESTVHIQNCNLSVGHMQQGILLVNVKRSYVRNNVISVYDTGKNIELNTLLQNKQARATLRNQLISRAFVGEKAPANGLSNFNMKFGTQALFFTTDKSLQRAWKTVFEENPPKNADTEKDVHRYIKNLVNRILTTDALRNKYPLFQNLLKTIVSEQRGVAAQGITIGGTTGKEIHILDNTIEGTLQGIHVGLSHPALRNTPDFAGNVTIMNNSVQVTLYRSMGKGERHGIFVGNCKNLVLENNTVKLERLEGTDNTTIDGIRVWGILGDRMMITQNYIASLDDDQKKSFTIGINVNPVVKKTSVAQWLVMYNVAPSKLTPVRVANGAIALPGTNAG